MNSGLSQIHQLAFRKPMLADMSLSLVVGLLFAFVFPCVLAAQQVVVVSSATLTRCDGAVQTVNAEGQATDAYVDTKLLPGQMLRTGAAGSAELKLDGGGAVRVEGNSEVKISEAKDGKPAPGSLEMLKGKLFLNIDSQALKKAGNREFRLKTPVAVLAVKGTKFFALSSEKGDTFGVHEGAVAVAEPQSKQVRQLKAGTAADASAGKLSAARALNPVEQAHGFTYPGAPALGWVIPIENGERCLTIGFIQTSNGDRYYTRKSAPNAYFDELWREKAGGKHEVVFRCKDSQSPPSISQILAGPDDSVYVWAHSSNRKDLGLYRIRGDKPVQALEVSVLWQEGLRDVEQARSVSFGWKPDGTVDPQVLYFSNGRGIFKSTWTSRKKATPPVLFTGIMTNASDFIIMGPDDCYKIDSTPGVLHVSSVRISAAKWQVIEKLACSESDPNTTIGAWPLVGKPLAKP